MKFTNKKTFFFLFNLSFKYSFCNRFLSYFAKPNFIVYDEWVDDDFQENKPFTKNKKNNKNVKHTLIFYEQSNYKVGASENNLLIDINENIEELFNNYYFENNSEKYDSLSDKKFLFSGIIINKKL